MKSSDVHKTVDILKDKYFEVSPFIFICSLGRTGDRSKALSRLGDYIGKDPNRVF